MAVGKYEKNGIKLSKKIIYKGDKLKITYNGLLAQSGAERIYLHYGFGSEWTDSSLVQMIREVEGFTAEVHILHQTSIELCFKDSADNWDNNSGENYLFGISAKAQRKTEKEPKVSKQSNNSSQVKTSSAKKASGEKKTSIEKKASPAKKASTKKKASIDVVEAV